MTKSSVRRPKSSVALLDKLGGAHNFNAQYTPAASPALSHPAEKQLAKTDAVDAYEKASAELGVRMIAYDGVVQCDEGDSQFHERAFFLRDLNSFFAKHSIAGYTIITTGGAAVDVLNLMNIILKKGGYEDVNKSRSMIHVLAELNCVPCNATRLKRFYIEYL